MNNIQTLLVQELVKQHKKIATAESCTGGLVSKKITEVSGASEVFDCGICSYANEIKHKLLGVSEETLNQFGAVSPQTAQEMADGVRKLANADFGISTTGIAGPTGATEGKPVGLVYIAVSSEKGCSVKKLLVNEEKPHSREEVREISAEAVLKEAYEIIKCE